MTEFLAAVGGAVVGGAIALALQMIALLETRKLREEDHKRVQQGLGASLLFKMMRIHSDFLGVHQHFDQCLERATQAGITGEPWQILQPLINPPGSVHFSAEEMAMLLAQKNDDLFNQVLSLDVAHNSMLEAFDRLNAERTALTDRLVPDQVAGELFSGVLSEKQLLALKPRMVAVNGLFEQLRIWARDDTDSSDKTLQGLSKLLREKLGLSYSVEPKRKDGDDLRTTD